MKRERMRMNEILEKRETKHTKKKVLCCTYTKRKIGLGFFFLEEQKRCHQLLWTQEAVKETVSFSQSLLNDFVPFIVLNSGNKPHHIMPNPIQSILLCQTRFGCLSHTKPYSGQPLSRNLIQAILSHPSSLRPLFCTKAHTVYSFSRNHIQAISTDQNGPKQFILLWNSLFRLLSHTKPYSGYCLTLNLIRSIFSHQMSFWLSSFTKPHLCYCLSQNLIQFSVSYTKPNSIHHLSPNLI